MVRKLLGNIKGAKGDKGDKGETGGFNGEIIGVQNLLDITNFTTYNGIGQATATVKDGVINYTGVPYFIETMVNLKKGNHVFSVKDFTSHSHAYGGNVRFQLMEGSTVLYTQDIPKGESFSFDVPKDGEYKAQIRISNVTQVSGFIEKPMLVEGEVSALWNPSETDNSFNKDYMRGRLTPDSFEVGANTPLNIVELDSDGIEYTETHILLTTPGTYLFTSNPSLSFGDVDGTLHISVYVNSVRVARFRNNGNMTVQTTHLFKASKGDTLSFEYYYEGESTGSTRFHFDDRNEFNIVRL